MNDHWKWLLILLPAIAPLGCSESETPAAREILQVYTTFYPTTYFAQRIGGDAVKVVCPLPAGEDPIFWMPPPATIADYQQADLIVINGADFEKWVGKVSLPVSKVVDTANPLEEQFLKFEQAITHSHGPGGEHSHEGVDGHTWLDPANAKVQADEIRKALTQLLPDRAEQFQDNYDALAVDLDLLGQSLAELSDELKDRHFLASHPAYNYLAQRYDWNLTNLDLDPEVMPDEAAFDEIHATLESSPASIILWESAPADEIAARFQSELGLTSVVFSPCEQPEEAPGAAEGDYLEVMGENATGFRDAITQ